MFSSCLWLFFVWLCTDYLFKFLVIGNAGVGKSCLLHQFIEQKCKIRKASYSYFCSKYCTPNTSIHTCTCNCISWETSVRLSFTCKTISTSWSDCLWLLCLSSTYLGSDFDTPTEISWLLYALQVPFSAEVGKACLLVLWYSTLCVLFWGSICMYVKIWCSR